MGLPQARRRQLAGHAHVPVRRPAARRRVGLRSAPSARHARRRQRRPAVAARVRAAAGAGRAAGRGHRHPAGAAPRRGRGDGRGRFRQRWFGCRGAFVPPGALRHPRPVPGRRPLAGRPADVFAGRARSGCVLFCCVFFCCRSCCGFWAWFGFGVRLGSGLGAAGHARANRAGALSGGYPGPAAAFVPRPHGFPRRRATGGRGRPGVRCPAARGDRAGDGAGLCLRRARRRCRQGAGAHPRQVVFEEPEPAFLDEQLELESAAPTVASSAVSSPAPSAPPAAQVAEPATPETRQPAAARRPPIGRTHSEPVVASRPEPVADVKAAQTPSAQEPAARPASAAEVAGARPPPRRT